MNSKPDTREVLPNTPSASKKPYPAPQLRREARMPLVTAGSFDLVIPNGPTPL